MSHHHFAAVFALLLSAARAGADDSRLVHLPEHGCYCGQKFTACRFENEAPDICVPGARLPSPQDDLDELCYHHDIGYCVSDPNAILAADKRLVEGLKSLPDDPRRWVKKPKCGKDTGQLRASALDPGGGRLSPNKTLTPSCMDSAAGYRRMALDAFQAKVAVAERAKYLNESLRNGKSAQLGQVPGPKPRSKPGRRTNASAEIEEPARAGEEAAGEESKAGDRDAVPGEEGEPEPAKQGQTEDVIRGEIAEMERLEKEMSRKIDERIPESAATRPEPESGAVQEAARTSKTQPPRTVFPKSPKGVEIIIDGGEIRGFRHGESPCPPLGDVTHVGVDIAPRACGIPVRSFADGKVVDLIATERDQNFGALGYMVIVKHNQAYAGKPVYSLYLHMQGPPEVRRDEAVYRGKALGRVGDTGKVVGGCHTHFELRHFKGRFLNDPDWNLRPGRVNIYGKPGLKGSRVVMENWMDPEEAFGLFPGGM